MCRRLLHAPIYSPTWLSLRVICLHGRHLREKRRIRVTTLPRLGPCCKASFSASIELPRTAMLSLSILVACLVQHGAGTPLLSRRADRPQAPPVAASEAVGFTRLADLCIVISAGGMSRPLFFVDASTNTTARSPRMRAPWHRRLFLLLPQRAQQGLEAGRARSHNRGIPHALCPRVTPEDTVEAL